VTPDELFEASVPQLFVMRQAVNKHIPVVRKDTKLTGKTEYYSLTEIYPTN
jgi:hypothetical protein